MSSYPKFFKREGKSLKPQSVSSIAFTYSKEKTFDPISSLMDEPTVIYNISGETQKKNYIKYLETKILETYNAMPVQKYAVMGVAVALFLFTGVASFGAVVPAKIEPYENHGYNIFSSKPLTYNYAVSQINTKDSRADKIDGVFARYSCPLEGLGGKFVEEADKYGIPWWLVASVAFKESSCGKNTPKIDGAETYNAWGWGVYGDNKHSFENFARGIETVSKYFWNNFYSFGIEDPCEIMKVYTPPSDGSWCADVMYFRDIFENYQTK